MSMKFLGDQLDIHCGGTDHIDVHHTNEMAQSEAATGKQFFNFWMHGEFLNIQGGKKMAKSEGNFLTLENAFIKNDIDPLVYRYASFHSHYRKPMEYSDDSAAAAGNGLRNLRGQVLRLVAKAGATRAPVHAGFKEKFLTQLNDDLNMPRALAVMQELLKADIDDAGKLATIREFDAAILGLELDREEVADPLPEEVLELMALREKARSDKDWAESDRIRDEIQAMGYTVQDGKEGMQVFKK
jgi:cysteinyl-tRNA synthetase